MKTRSALVIIAVLFVAAHAKMPQAQQANAASGANSDPAIVDKLREILSIRETLVEANRLAVRNGRGETDGRHALALAEARLALADELDQHDEQVAALAEALKVHQRRLEFAKRRAEAGSASPEDVETIRVAVLETEVRLLRKQNSSKAP